MFAQVIVDIANSGVDRLFTYRAEDNIILGQRVLVPFGSGNKPIEGYVLGISESYEGNIALKSIIRPLEPYSVLTHEQIRLAYWIKQSYNCLLVDSLRLMIPAQLRRGRVKEKRVRTVKLADGVDPQLIRAGMLKKDGSPKSPKQKEVFDLLSESNAEMSTADICAFIPGASSAIKALIDKGYITEAGRETYRDPYAGRIPPRTMPLTLSAAQADVLEKISAAMDRREGTMLLHGVTGSGKTEVYMQAIAKVLDEGGSAIVLVPEISLTPQAMDRFRGRFGEQVAVLHSRLSPGERYDEWRRIRLGKAKVVLGARSAVFAPLENIRLIVVDEEHEQSYSSEMTPRYSAIEVAQKRCKLNGGVLLLGSATPSVTSYFRAKRGRYALLELPERINDLPLPKVDIVDMRQEFAAGNTGIFSGRLYHELKACLDRNEQAILFINRRGYSTFVSCRSCGYVFKCDNCDVSMTYHKIDKLMKCHYCGRTARIPAKCPQCGKPYLKYFGVGTQQVEEQLRDSFPGVKSLRMDMDTTQTRNAHYDILSRFSRGDAQVLIGTQMVAKGLDFENVTLVGVLSADLSLYVDHYRAAERTFNLLTQVVGRAGRGDKAGRAVIQTYTPENDVIQAAAAQDYQRFYDAEIPLRRLRQDPPFADQFTVTVTGPEETPVRRAIELLRQGIGNTAEKPPYDTLGIQVIGPAPAPVVKVNGVYRYRLLVLGKNTAPVRELLAGFMRAFVQRPENRRLHIYTDCDKMD